MFVYLIYAGLIFVIVYVGQYFSRSTRHGFRALKVIKL